MAQSVCGVLQETVHRQVKDLALDRVGRNLTSCEQPFSELDIRPGAYLTHEGRNIGNSTNQRDDWGYKYQLSIIAGSGSGRRDERETWMKWIQRCIREFNNKRPSVRDCPELTHLLPCKARIIDVPDNDLHDKGFDGIFLEIVVWVRETRTQ